jgi:D-sedoheptulose 7-phosphate isomerase
VADSHRGEISVEKIIQRALRESIKAKEDFIRENTNKLILFANKIALALMGDRKLLLCGNGGSAADAQHIAAEFINRYELERPPLPALALTTDTSILTSVGNDYSMDEIFSKQVKALGVEGDVLLAISTSGNSANVLKAVETAKNQGIFTVGLTGGNGGKLADLAEMSLVVKSHTAARIQEAHILAGHIICELVDYILFQQGVPKPLNSEP